MKTRKDIYELREHIETGGLAESLIVRKNNQDDTYDVLEGNRRLAACLMIEEANPKKKTELSLSCEVVPKKFLNSHIFTLLSTLHVPGKLPWNAFAKASLITRRFEALRKEKYSKDAALEKTMVEFSEKKSEVKTLIANIDLMKWSNEKKTGKYSYYDVLNRNRVVRADLRELHLRKRWVDSIQTWNKRASGFRDAIRSVIMDPTALDKFRKGALELEEAAQQAIDSGSTDEIYQRVKKFRISIENVKPRFKRMEGKDSVIPKLKFEFENLKALTEDVIKILGKKNG